jgi:transcriptional regulator with XRE-family HTH domain
VKACTYPPDSLVAQVGRRIRALRNERGVSLRAFGEAAGVHPFHVMAIELGQLSTSTKTLGLIAKELGLSSTDLLNHASDASHIEAIFELLRQHPALVAPTLQKVRRLAGDKLTSKRRGR